MITVAFTLEKWEAIRNTLELTEGADYQLVLSISDGDVNALKENNLNPKNL
jgi:hypothetical protein